MKYNKNIILNILSSKFFEQITEYTLECVWQLDESDLWNIFDEEAVCADLDNIDSLRVTDYSVHQDEESEHICGTLEVSAFITGYAHWDGENLYLGSRLCPFDMTFGFYRTQDKYFDLKLEYIC